MAKDITIKNPEGTLIYYPKTVSQLVYDNANGQTVATEISELNNAVEKLDNDFNYTPVLNDYATATTTIHTAGYRFPCNGSYSNSDYAGKYIAGVEVNVEGNGTIELVKGTGITNGSTDYTITVLKSFSTKAGINRLMFDTPILFSDGEYLGIHNTGTRIYGGSNSLSNPPVRMKYVASATNSIAISSTPLAASILVDYGFSERLDAVEENMVTDADLEEIEDHLDQIDEDVYPLFYANACESPFYDTATDPTNANAYRFPVDGSYTNLPYRNKKVIGFKIKLQTAGTVTIVLGTNIQKNKTSEEYTLTDIQSFTGVAGHNEFYLDEPIVVTDAPTKIGVITTSKIYQKTSASSTARYDYISNDTVSTSTSCLSFGFILDNAISERVDNMESAISTLSNEVDTLEGNLNTYNNLLLTDVLTSPYLDSATSTDTAYPVVRFFVGGAGGTGAYTNSAYINKKIVGMKCKIGRVGTLTFIRSTGVKRDNPYVAENIVEIQTYSVTSTGLQTFYFDTPVLITEQYECIGVYERNSSDALINNKATYPTDGSGKNSCYYKQASDDTYQRSAKPYCISLIVSAIGEGDEGLSDRVTELEKTTSLIPQPLLDQPFWWHWRPDGFTPISWVYNFTVSGVTTPPIAGDVYKNTATNITCVVLSTNLTDGSGTITCECSGYGTPSKNATYMKLTRQSGEGDATITYSAYAYKRGIPSQSVEDNLMAFRMGFNMVEANVQNTSDGKFVVTHGQTINGVAGCFGNEFSEPYRSTKISSMTQSDIVANVNYASAYDCYNHHISTAEEFFANCANLNLGILLRTSSVDALTLARKYLPDYKINISLITGAFGNSARGAGFKGMLGWYLGTDTPSIEACRNACNSYGGAPFHVGYHGNSIQTLIDNGTLEEFVTTLRQEGIYIGAAYADTAQSARLIAAGGWGIASQIWQCNPFNNANVGAWGLTDDDFSDWALGAGVVISGGSVINNTNDGFSFYTPSTGKIKVGKGNIQAKITGTVSFTVGTEVVTFANYTDADPMLNFAIGGMNIDMRVKVTLTAGSSVKYFNYQVTSC